MAQAQMRWDAMSACLKEQAGRQRSQSKECYPKLFMAQHTVILVLGQGWQRRQGQRRCWVNPSLSPVPCPHSLSQALSPLPQAPHAAVRDSRQAGNHFLRSQSQAATCLLLTNPM